MTSAIIGAMHTVRCSYLWFLLVAALPALMLLPATPSLGAEEASYHNHKYGWRIDVPDGFVLDETLAPDTVTFKLEGDGLITIESGLPDEYFWDPGSASLEITRVMNFAADEVEISLIEPGETIRGIHFEDINYRVKTGTEQIYGLLRLYNGPNGIVLCYRDSPWDFEDNIDKVRDFADGLFFPTLGELMAEGEFELVQFTNPAYGYRLSYPLVLDYDEVWSFVTFTFLNSSLFDIHSKIRLEQDPLLVLESIRDAMLEDFAIYNYEVASEVYAKTDDGYDYLDLMLNDRDEDPWLKRARVFVLPKAVVKFEMYCRADEFEVRNTIFNIIIDSFEYNPEWVTEESYSFYDIPIEEIYQHGEYEWIESINDEYGFIIEVPEFLTPEDLAGDTFFNYNYETIIGVIIEFCPGMNRAEALSHASAGAQADFGVTWDFTRHGDATGVTSDGWPYSDFALDDNDPDGSWTKRVRVYGLDGFAVRIEMYLSPGRLDMLDSLFDKVAGSFRLK